MTTQSTYILSLEASDIFSHIHRNAEINFDYCGMIPYSLELIKLKKQKDFTTFTVKHSEKEFSNDLINVKFNQKVKSAEYLIKNLNKKIEDINNKEDYKNKLIAFKKLLESEINNDAWQEVRNEELRKQLYKNGFTITFENGKQIKYVVYKRSSSKSRKGQCLFIKEELYQEMINWSRMYLPFEKDMEIDYASLLAYESLVLSSLESTIKINPKNILIVDDVESKFNQVCNVIRKGNNDFLDSFTEEVEVKNSLFDGESLLDSKFFEKGQSMKLLRNHMFKSAAFNCNIQQFLQDHCPDNVNYDEWILTDLFNYPIYAKDVELIITPNSLKALKFSHVMDSEKEMWNYWQELVDREGCIFGVCKHEKKSKRGIDENGNTLQQTSYQMLNSLPMTKENIADLTVFEKDFIDKLKNDDDFFIQYIMNNANDMNSNLMFADLYKINKYIVNTKIFRDFRKSEINKYVTHVKNGKVRLVGDYCVLLGNPVEFLYHAIGQFDVHNSALALNENEIHTTLFNFDKELVGFRNPHTSPSNVLKVKNTYSKEIYTYFNLSNNIVCVNAVRFPLQDILSGSDYDSDTILLFDEVSVLEAANKCYGKYHVCINKVESQKKQYKLNKKDMYEIDNQLSASQRYIGEVVNIGQLCMSRYWDLKNRGTVDQKILDYLLRKTDVMTIISGIAIDMAKKFYEIDIEKEIKHVVKNLKLKNKKTENKTIPAKPIFFKYISQNENTKNKVVKYNCPMDYLYEEMDNLPYANHHENVDFTSLLEKKNIKDGNRKQEQKIIDYVEAKCNKINYIMATFNDKNERDDRNNMIDSVIKYYNFYMEKLSVKPDTMYSLLVHMIKNKSKNATKLMNILYSTQKEVFLNAFKQHKKVTK